MNVACFGFRARLASLLSGRVANREVGVLAWHEHLLGCEDCRALLEAEEALEALLASLPEPKLPPELAQRVLSRLEPARSDTALDLLLDRSSAPVVPPDLARTLLAKLAGARRDQHDERRLDLLLERVPDEQAPAELSRRVLAALQAERARRSAVDEHSPQVAASPARASSPAARPLRAVANTRAGAAHSLPSARPARNASNSAWRSPLLAASIALAIGAAVWLRFALGSASPDDPAPFVARPDEPRTLPNGTAPLAPPTDTIDEPPDDLLASLDLLESWELVTDGSLESELTTTADFDALLRGLDTQGAAIDAAGAAEPVAPKKEESR